MARDARRWLMVAIAFLSLGRGLLPIAAAAVAVGEHAPDFVMHSTVGESVRLADYQGRKHVLVFFFPAAFTTV
jgi:peroxiredoxin